MPPVPARNCRRLILSLRLAWSAISFTRASTFFWSSVCGIGMCSPFDTIWVGIGEWNRLASSARVSLESCSSLSQTSASRSPRIAMVLLLLKAPSA